MMHEKAIQSSIRILRAALLPAIVFAVQYFSGIPSLILLAVLVLTAICFRQARNDAVLLIIMVCGFMIWSFVSAGIDILANEANASAEWPVVFSRLGLVGYLVLFVLWNILHKSTTDYFTIGNFDAKIRFPLIWYGVKDTVLRISVVFSLLCVAGAGVLFYFNKFSLLFIGYALLFAVINSLLEELLWRGFVMGRTVDLYGEKTGLLSMCLTFGLYHYSLGFSLPVCLFFSLGGFYFGGVALRSRGLLPPVIMHLSMNLLFAAAGIIF